MEWLAWLQTLSLYIFWVLILIRMLDFFFNKNVYSSLKKKKCVQDVFDGGFSRF